MNTPTGTFSPPFRWPVSPPRWRSASQARNPPRRSCARGLAEVWEADLQRDRAALGGLARRAVVEHRVERAHPVDRDLEAKLLQGADRLGGLHAIDVRDRHHRRPG